MDLYTLNKNFIPGPTVDEFESVIWTERYSAAGEVQLVVPADPYNLEILKEGTYLGLAGSDEIMELQTDSIEKGLMTVVGKTLVRFLDERVHWAKTDDPAQPVGDYTPTADAKLGEVISDRVEKMVISPVPFPATGNWQYMNIDWERDKIDRLTLGSIDTSGEAKRWTIPVGPLYSVIQPVAEKDGLGFTLYLESADEELGYQLKFKTYRGVDRTSTNPDPNALIRLTPNMENMGDLKELRSIDGYKNVVYVVYKNKIYIRYEDPANIPEGLDRRVMVLDAEGEPIGTQQDLRYGNAIGRTAYYGGAFQRTYVSEADITKFIDQNAKDALANHNYIKALEGETSNTSEYKFGTDYGLGDVLELESLTGTVTKARVTEYIRSQDKKGMREYPTLSVIT